VDQVLKQIRKINKSTLKKSQTNATPKWQHGRNETQNGISLKSNCQGGNSWNDWMGSVISRQKNRTFKGIVSELLAQIGIVDGKQEFNVDHLKAVEGTLDAKLKQQDCAWIGEKVIELLKDGVTKRVKAEERSRSSNDKFGELVLGDAKQFFKGLDALIGVPNHLDLEGRNTKVKLNSPRRITTSPATQSENGALCLRNPTWSWMEGGRKKTTQK